MKLYETPEFDDHLQYLTKGQTDLLIDDGRIIYKILKGTLSLKNARVYFFLNSMFLDVDRMTPLLLTAHNKIYIDTSETPNKIQILFSIHNPKVNQMDKLLYLGKE